MNWEAIGAIGEIVGAIAVIATLIYIATQVKDSARAARSAAVTDAATAMQAFYQELGSNRQISELWLEAMTSPEAMSREDEFQFVMMTHSAFLGFQTAFFLAQEGTLDIGFRESIGTAITAVKDLPGMERVWRQRKAFFQEEFVEWVEELMARESIETLDVYRGHEGPLDG